MTDTADRIRALGSMMFALDEEVEQHLLEPLRRDPHRGRTVASLIADDTAQRLIRGLSWDHATAFIQLVAGACDDAGADRIRATIRESKPSHLWQFDLSHDLHTQYRRLGSTRLAAPHSTVTPESVRYPAAGFSGVGATGVSPRSVSVGLLDQLRMFLGNENVRARYSNPLYRLDVYLDELTQEQRRRQGEILTQLPIVSGVPYSYAVLPSRRSVLELAARVHNLHPELIAAFLLAEQRDQSQLEDGKDYSAATSLVRANTSIGLGQVVISTARRADLFSDLLSHRMRSNLSHVQIAYLLASDEFNMFAVAKYIRMVADDGARRSAANLPRTVRDFPGLDLAAYARNSRTWPADNIMALASEYTSAAWDDQVFEGWGWFVYEAYLDFVPSGAASAGGPVGRTELRERYRSHRERRESTRGAPRRALGG